MSTATDARTATDDKNPTKATDLWEKIRNCSFEPVSTSNSTSNGRDETCDIL